MEKIDAEIKAALERINCSIGQKVREAKRDIHEQALDARLRLLIMNLSDVESWAEKDKAQIGELMARFYYWAKKLS